MSSSQELPMSQGLSQVLSQDDFVSDSDSSSSATNVPKRSSGTRDAGRHKSKTRSACEDSDCETRLSDSAEDDVEEAKKQRSGSAKVKAECIAGAVENVMVDFRVRDPEAALSDEEEEDEKVAREPLGSTEETLSEASMTDLLETETKAPTTASSVVRENAEGEADDSGVPEDTSVAHKSEPVDAAAASASPAGGGGDDPPSVVATNEGVSEASSVEPYLVDLERQSDPPVFATSRNDQEQVVDHHSSPPHDDVAAQCGESCKLEDTTVVTSEQMDSGVTSSSVVAVDEQTVRAIEAEDELKKASNAQEQSGVTVSAPSTSTPTDISSNVRGEVVIDRSTMKNEDVSGQPSGSNLPADTPAVKTKQVDSEAKRTSVSIVVEPVIASNENVNELQTPTSNQKNSSARAPIPSSDQQISLPSESHAEQQVADCNTSPASNGDSVLRSEDVPMSTAVIKAEQVEPVTARTSAASVLATNEVNSDSNGPASSLEPSDATVSAPPSDPLVLVTSSNTNSDPEPEPVVGPSHPPPPEQPPRTLKRYAEMNNVQLKKQKLALESLKLELELGVITRKECVEKGRLLVTQTSS